MTLLRVRVGLGVTVLLVVLLSAAAVGVGGRLLMGGARAGAVQPGGPRR